MKPSNRLMNRTLFFCLFNLPVVFAATLCLAADPVPLTHAHAHNDYMHKRPLLDALDQGFCSIEADIWLVDNELLVAHDQKAVKPGHTLQSMYLDPLRARIQHNGLSVYAGGPPCILLVDVKSEALTTTKALFKILENYTNILTSFTATTNTTNALTIILSGNRATDYVASLPLRYAAIDGSLDALDTNPSIHLVPLVSASWSGTFKWRGGSPLPKDESSRLSQYVKKAHAQGRIIRFWAIPDRLEGWRTMQSAGVDLINTDRLADLAKFFAKQRQSSTNPPASKTQPSY